MPAGDSIHSDRPIRLPRALVAASLIAMLALYLSGPNFPGLLICMTVLAASTLTAKRVPNEPLILWPMRLSAFVTIVFTVGPLPAMDGIFSLVNPAYAYLFGYLCAAELVIRAWTRRYRPTVQGEIAFLSALVLMASTNTFDYRYLRYLAPIYAVLLALAFPRFGTAIKRTPRPRPVLAAFVLCLGGALLVGLGLATLIRTYGDEVTAWSARLLLGGPQSSSVGMGDTPRLTSTFNPELSSEPVLLIDGPLHDPHLRGLVYDQYRMGVWGPRPDARVTERVGPAALAPETLGRSVRVHRLADELGLVYAPLHVGGFRAPAADVRQYIGGDRSLRIGADTNDPIEYELILSDQQAFQGPLCVPPGPEALAGYLEVPEEIAPFIGALASEISTSPDPLRRMMEVESYLRTHHGYSLNVTVGAGDPLVDFLTNRKDGHCQFFASSAVMLLRSMGIPARLATGYYVHEQDGRGLIARQRDAHAWVECWIEGIGWVVSEPTPPGGRPDVINQPTPLRKARDGLADAWRAVRQWYTNLTLLRALILIACGVLVLLAFRAFRQWRQRGAAPIQRGYSPIDPALLALAARFGKLLDRWQVSCPPTLTWREHVASLDGQVAGRFEAAKLRRFLELYDAVRYGDQRTTAREELAQLLSDLERAATFSSRGRQ